MELALKLERPLIVFDVETTGLSITQDRIIELSYVKVYPDGREQEGTYRINPCKPISAEAKAVHHITDADVAQCPTFDQLALEIAELFSNCDIAGFNSNHFDIPILAQEMASALVRATQALDEERQKSPEERDSQRIDALSYRVQVLGAFDVKAAHFVDVQTIFHKKEKRDLAAACLFYCGEEMENHHNALADARTTLKVLKAQLHRYDDLGDDVAALSRYSSHNRNVDLAGRVVLNDAGQPVINFGRYRGQLLDEVVARDTGYAGWVQSGDFAIDTKQVFLEARKRVQAKKAQREPTNAEIEELKKKFNIKG